MKKHFSLHLTFGILMVLTLLTAISANTHQAAFVLLGFAIIKLLFVAFQFMELSKAHLFWKTTVVIFSLSVFTILSLMSH